MEPRLPDFVIIGAMKSGTTSLYRWLEAQPEIWLPECKEPHYFSRDDVFRKGPGWYSDHFAPAAGRITGEASASYTSPESCEAAATRMAHALPDAKLIYLVRHPLDRARSHHSHEVQRGRETRPAGEALTIESNYIGQSLYFRCLSPFLARFPREAIRVVRFEDLIGPGHPGWSSVLAHLGVPEREPPGTVHNVTSAKRQYTRLGRWFWDAGLLQRRVTLPAPIRRVARRLLTSDPMAAVSSITPRQGVSEDVALAIADDAGQLAQWLGRQALWNLDDGAVAPS